MKSSIMSLGKLFIKSNVISLAALAGILLAGYFFIDAFTPDITEINAAESLAIENGTRFYVTKALKVKTMDGQSVKWNSKFTANAILVSLSPGPHAFILDFETSDSDTKWSAKDLKISADFKSGKYYRFDYTLDRETKKISYSIKETDPVVYKSGFDPKYSFLVMAAIAFIIAVVFIVIARKKGVVYNITDD